MYHCQPGWSRVEYTLTNEAQNHKSRRGANLLRVIRNAAEAVEHLQVMVDWPFKNAGVFPAGYLGPLIVQGLVLLLGKPATPSFFKFLAQDSQKQPILYNPNRYTSPLHHSDSGQLSQAPVELPCALHLAYYGRWDSEGGTTMRREVEEETTHELQGCGFICKGRDSISLPAENKRLEKTTVLGERNEYATTTVLSVVLRTLR
ncbi:hypothetical protein DFP72DRAFT_849457 [Ephemerocybe angulata]|uniref:Uncharacterized protein n=1 Tax=Ephemerocybe angulata TaxID=980116 RepID=A0A8H6HUH2_9AGAR|nr:hypothetical protein DFP72DRAFT_849457 [Tulosesus angulatus]